MNGLTFRQRAVFEFIEDEIAAKGYPPSIRQIAARLGIRSANGVVGHLTALEKKGRIQRDKNLARAIRLTTTTTTTKEGP